MNSTATNPEIIGPTDLHNDCGLVAAAAFKYLFAHGVKAKVLNIRYGPDEGHVVVVYQSGGRLATYDHDGSMIFDEEIDWEINPKKAAQYWADANSGKSVISAFWH